MKKFVLILGVSGMAGHTIFEYLSSLNKYQIVTMARDSKYIVPNFELDIKHELDSLKFMIINGQFDVIINCIGLLVKASEENPAKAIYVNSYFPHWLENVTKNTKTKVIQLSTDCVFSGDKGNYSDTDFEDGKGYYAQSKILGEIINGKNLTIRTSIIGDELKENGTGLFNWFMNQEGTVKGFRKHYWSGITTLCLAQNIDKMIDTNIIGLYQLAPDYCINKYDLLNTIKEVWNKQITIDMDTIKCCDKTLECSYRENFQPIIPVNYKQMLIEMKEWIERKPK